MYKTFQDLLRLAISMGEIQSAEFNADHGEYRHKGIRVNGITPDGEKFTVSLEYEKVNPNAD
jgi:hypothetical protein